MNAEPPWISAAECLPPVTNRIDDVQVLVARLRRDARSPLSPDPDRVLPPFWQYFVCERADDCWITDDREVGGFDFADTWWQPIGAPFPLP